MENNIPKDAIKSEVTTLNVELSDSINQSETNEIVIYDECGDTMWDRVLRQKEGKIKADQTSAS